MVNRRQPELEPREPWDMPTLETRRYVPEPENQGLRLGTGIVCIIVAAAGLVCEWVFNHPFSQDALSMLYTGYNPVRDADLTAVTAVILSVVYACIAVMGFGLILSTWMSSSKR